LIVPVDEVGIYFGRYNQLATWKLADVLEASEFERFRAWFRADLTALE